jgi:hypothetical protein
VKRPCSRTLATAFSVAAIIALIGCFSDANASTRRKPRRQGRKPAAQAAKSDVKVAEDGTAKRVRTKRRPGRRLDDTVLRYLPDNCRVFASIDVAPILQSEIGRKLFPEGSDYWEQFDESFAPLGLEIGQIERIELGAPSLSEGTEFLAVLFYQGPFVSSEKDLKADGTQWTTETIGPLTVWVKGGEEPWAICAVGGDVALAGHPELLRAVLRRDGPAELPEKLDQARRLLDPSAALGLTFLQDAVGAMSYALGIPYFAGRIDAVNVELDFDADMATRLTAVCRDEETAQQLNGMVTGLWTLVQMQGLQNQEPLARELLWSVTFDVQGRMVTAKMTVPAELVNVTSSEAKPVALSSRQASPATSSSTASNPYAPARYPAVAPKASGPYAPAYGSGYKAPTTATPSPYTPTQYSAPGPTYPYSGPGAVPAASWQRPAPASATLKVADVIRLVEAGVDDEVIARHARKHTLAAPLTVDDLILLTESGASPQVITTLQEIPATPRIDPQGYKKAPR